jgi:ABC-type multidrug transport system ATPase subunit
LAELRSVSLLSHTRDDGATLLVLSGIRRSWGAQAVIDGVDLTLRRGTVAWIGGPNGAGKTTLLRVVAGLIAPDDGELSFAGLDPTRDRSEYQRRLGWLPAGNGGVYNRLTVRQNLAYWAAIAFVPRSRRRNTIEAAIAQFDLERLAAKRADRISMGERQRLRLAMTFLHEPELVLLDEPHTSIDEDGLHRLRAALDGLSARGGAALWCSPSRDGVRLPAGESYLVQDGHLVPC